MLPVLRPVGVDLGALKKAPVQKLDSGGAWGLPERETVLRPGEVQATRRRGRETRWARQGSSGGRMMDVVVSMRCAMCGQPGGAFASDLRRLRSLGATRPESRRPGGQRSAGATRPICRGWPCGGNPAGGRSAARVGGPGGAAGVFLDSSDSGASTGLTARGQSPDRARSSPKRGISGGRGPERVEGLGDGW